jgi:hypothetical protein
VRRLAMLAGVAVFAVAPNAWGHAKTDGSEPAPAKIARLVTHVPAATLDAVGAGQLLQNDFFGKPLSSPLTSDGKPELLSFNFSWCPHCAASNWGLAVALSRFGRLSGLRVIDSGTHYCKLAASPCLLKPGRCFPHTKGISFFGAHFTSSYLTFVDVIGQDVNGHKLQTPTPAEKAALKPMGGGAPTLNFGGVFGAGGEFYSPGDLAGKSWSQIAGGLADPKNKIAQRVDGLANFFSAVICRKMTNNQPASVCQSSGVNAAYVAAFVPS